MIKNELIRIAGNNALCEESSNVLKLCKVVNYIDVQLNAVKIDLINKDCSREDIIEYIDTVKETACDMLKN